MIDRLSRKKVHRYLEQTKLQKVISVINGGKTRQESSYNGLKSLREKKPEIVVIHEAVRPFVTTAIIRRSIIAAKKYGAADVVVPAIDTIVEGRNGFITSIPNRDSLFHGQTPQAFRYEIIWKAHQMAIKEGVSNRCEDTCLVLRLGLRVKQVLGTYENIKMTVPLDGILMERIYHKKP